MNLQKQTLLVVAPHPDDEAIGCGGLIRKVKSLGGIVHVMVMTIGSSRDFSDKGSSSSIERNAELKKRCSFLELLFYFSDSMISSVNEEIFE